MSLKMLMFHVPSDQKLLAALGEVTLRNEHLNHVLKMTIKSIAGITPAEAIDATQYQGASELRERIRKLAKQRLGDGEPLLKLQALLTRAGRLADKRNELTHGLWAQELDGKSGVMGALGELSPLPSLDELVNLANDIEALTNELNTARLEGFLKIALDKKNNKVHRC